ncbi:MAG: PKD domain-containing protein [Bacteroidota bacterium]
MKSIPTHLIALIAFVLGPVGLSARHIIGGDVTYECNGDGTYTFEMRVYRDCASSGAEFDDPAIVTIYRETASGFQQVLNLEVGLSGPPMVIPPPDNPCLILPPNVCVEQGRYVFTVALEDIPDSYHVIYQRCCRNNTITNIEDPGSKGATYSVEITPEAQIECNNAPVFNDFPPIIICAGQPLSFDHSATDSDGDQLVYEFCAPLLGGGLLGSQGNGTPEDAVTCNGVTPNPACPPPHGTVSFIFPEFNITNPMAGNPVVRIDPLTGVISGTPEILGQFVVGVCVREFRNGVLLSEIRRDFQFNVADCEPTVDARIRSDASLGFKQFVVNSCGNTTVTFDNQSVQRRFIDEFFWEFDIAGSTQTFTEWDATVSFPDTGTYEGVLVLNPGLECGDTANIFVNIFPDIRADFSFEYDTCVAGPVTFTDLSVSDAGPIQQWFWNFNDGNTSDEINPVHLFSSPGNLPVSLIVTDENRCMDTSVQIIPWFPAPPIIVIEPTTFIGCAPEEIFFNNLSTPIDETYTILWDFGDGTTSDEISPTHLYAVPGVYDVSVEITSPIGCFISESYDDWITVRPSPIADFFFTPDNPSNFEPEVSFFDQSIDAIAWEWLFDDHGTSFEMNPIFSFPDTGLQEITLIVTHPSGCTDTMIQFLDVEPQVRYFLPNAFTPNNDDVNDFFQGAGVFEGIDNFSMTIWNRWGELVFQTRNFDEGWNGRKNNTGALSPSGVYVYVVRYRGPRGGDIELKGFATLIK